MEYERPAQERFARLTDPDFDRAFDAAETAVARARRAVLTHEGPNSGTKQELLDDFERAVRRFWAVRIAGPAR